MTLSPSTRDQVETVVAKAQRTVTPHSPTSQRQKAHTSHQIMNICHVSFTVCNLLRLILFFFVCHSPPLTL